MQYGGKSAYCPDSLIRVTAAGAALNTFSRKLLAQHIRTCTALDIRNGKDEAIDAADVALTKSRLSGVSAVIRFSRTTLRNIHQNLFRAFFPNTVSIPLTIGVFIPLSLMLNPIFAPRP